MSLSQVAAGLVAVASMMTPVDGQKSEDLILCDCGLGDNKAEPSWSTSRQMNWYKSIQWPDSAYSWPNAPDMDVQVPFNDGTYPWITSGASAKMANGDVWTAYIADTTPDGYKAGYAESSKNGGDTLNCWAYHGRPVSAAINKTVNADAICWSAFVCNHDSSPPARPSGMGSMSSTLTTSSAAPETSFVSAGPPSGAAPTGSPSPPPNGGKPQPTANPKTGELLISASVNPRFITWKQPWADFIRDFVWNPSTGRCIGPAAQGMGYNITFDCAGIQVDQDTHMTLLLIQALQQVGLMSEWFSQSPAVPGAPGTPSNTTSYVVMPEAFTIEATDAATNDVVGYITYKTNYNGFVTGPCSTCDKARFNKNFFNPIIAALEGSYPVYKSFTVQAQCDPWMVC